MSSFYNLLNKRLKQEREEKMTIRELLSHYSTPTGKLIEFENCYGVDGHFWCRVRENPSHFFTERFLNATVTKFKINHVWPWDVNNAVALYVEYHYN